MAADSTSNGARKRWVVVKNDKFATVGGGLGARPKVYATMKAAQYDIDSIAKLKGGIVKPYTGDDGTDVPAGAQATTARAKAATRKAARSAAPKRAAAGK